MDETNIKMGWQEWVSLPSLGLPAVLAKIDTGATLSALDVISTDVFIKDGQEYVRFGLRPVPERPDFICYHSAPVKDRLDITSSNGQTENRFIISTTLCVDKNMWEIDISLTNRHTMQYRMLLGRQALADGNVFVDPTKDFVQPELSYGLYRQILD